MADELDDLLWSARFGYEAESGKARDAIRAHVAKLEESVQSLTNRLANIDDDARAAGLTYDAVRALLVRYRSDNEDDWITFGKLVEDLRSLARVAAERMSADADATISDLLDQCARLRGRLRDARTCLGASREALQCRAEKAERERDELRSECAQISSELGLPPTMRPSEGELARMMQRAKRTEAAEHANAELRERVKHTAETADLFQAQADELRAQLEREREDRHRVVLSFGADVDSYRQRCNAAEARARLWKRAAKQYRDAFITTRSVRYSLLGERAAVEATLTDAGVSAFSDSECSSPAYLPLIERVRCLVTERDELRAKLERWETAERVSRPCDCASLGGRGVIECGCPDIEWARVPGDE
jgi:chromosome segregation ATPase